MTETKKGDIATVLSARAGKVVRVERTFYDFKGVIDETQGDIQIQFSDGCARFRSARGGEVLEVEESPWSDPFAEPLTDENELFVASHGKWRLIDVSGRAHYRDLIGESLSNVRILANRSGRPCGVKLAFGAAVMNVFVDGDEVCVSWGESELPAWIAGA